MIESRCGILCEECGYRESTDRIGGTAVSNPFWGSCPVKHCCEEKKLDHCGRCEDFPCDLLNQFAYDEEQGDHGKRIEQCNIWCGKQVGLWRPV